MKKIVTTIISALMMISVTSFADNSESVSLEKQYRESLFSIIKSELNVTKSDLVKNSDTIKKIDEYVSNSISLEIGIDEFESMVKSEIGNVNINIDKNNSDKPNTNDNSKEKCSNEKTREYIICAKNFVSREYNISRNELNSSKFENYVEDISDEYNEMGISREFEEFFRTKFREDFEKYDTEMTVMKVFLGIATIVLFVMGIAFIIEYGIKEGDFRGMIIGIASICIGIIVLYEFIK